MEHFSDFRNADGSRHFLSLPDTRKNWYEIRDHINKLNGASLTDFITDNVTEAWIDFEFEYHKFSINDQMGEYWFMVEDPNCPDNVLQKVAMHFKPLLGE